MSRTMGVRTEPLSLVSDLSAAASISLCPLGCGYAMEKQEKVQALGSSCLMLGMPSVGLPSQGWHKQRLTLALLLSSFCSILVAIPNRRSSPDAHAGSSCDSAGRC